MTNNELRAEAERLLNLGDQGLQIEQLAIVLRMGETASNFAAFMNELEWQTLEAITGKTIPRPQVTANVVGQIQTTGVEPTGV